MKNILSFCHLPIQNKEILRNIFKINNKFLSIKYYTLIILLTISIKIYSQSNFNYEIELIPVTLSNLPGLHSFTFAQYQDKWLIIGGRKDGLHARQPFNAFPPAQNNSDIYVVDIKSKQVWSSNVSALSMDLKDQLQSSNMNFYQEKDNLYLVGGYGFSEKENDHITFPYLTAINVPELIIAIQNQQSLSPYFKQIKDDIFAVTGGHLTKLNDLFFLIGGHRFDGRYNPMGHATYEQAYTNQIRKFSIENTPSQISFSQYSAITDPVHLRRRDYNLLPQIFPNGEQGFTISSGVFQINEDLPFLHPVDITENNYFPITSFNQYLSNYHSATASLYDSVENKMHSLFFGGMSQYYYQNNTLIQDDLVPFVKTISRVSRDANGTLTEYQLPVEMPGLKGSSAELIPNLDLPFYSNGVIKLNQIPETSFMIGHIVGGIESSTINPFSFNQTEDTNADATIYEVWLTVKTTSVDEYEIDGRNPFDFIVFPNPFENEITIQFSHDSSGMLSYFVSNDKGVMLLKSQQNTPFLEGKNSFTINLEEEKNEEVLFLTLIFNDKYYITKKIINTK